MKTLLITGGSSGIGLATVELFAAKGWQVFELSRSGLSHDSVIHISCDVTNEQSVQAAVEEVMYGQENERCIAKNTLLVDC